MTMPCRPLTFAPRRATPAEQPLWLMPLASHGEGTLSADRESLSWCALGCGSGVGAVINAAANPLGRFVAIDARAEPVLRGRRLAEAAGVNNVVFLQASYATLALTGCDRGPLHDLILVDRQLRAGHDQAVQRCIERWLKPGGTVIELDEAASVPSGVGLLSCEEPARPAAVLRQARSHCERLNRLICRQALEGAGHHHLAAPVLGAALPADLLQMAALRVLLECPGVEGALMREMVRILLREAGLACSTSLIRRLDCFERLVLPHWRRLGMLPADAAA